MTDPKAIEGWFLTFVGTEEKDLKEFLEEQDYSPDVSGLKQWIMDAVYISEEEEKKEKKKGRADTVIEKAADYIANNPEKIRAAAQLAGSIFKRRS